VTRMCLTITFAGSIAGVRIVVVLEEEAVGHMIEGFAFVVGWACVYVCVCVCVCVCVRMYECVFLRVFRLCVSLCMFCLYVSFCDDFIEYVLFVLGLVCLYVFECIKSYSCVFARARVENKNRSFKCVSPSIG
jgi:hypothetical protein